MFYPPKTGSMWPLFLSLVFVRVVRADSVPNPLLPGPAAIQFQEEVALQKLVQKIDQHLDDFWTRNNIKPANRTSDGEFLRRVCLDVIGRIPTASETRAFLDDPSPNKRQKWIDQLISRSAYANYWANVLRQEWAPTQSEDFRIEIALPLFEGWLNKQIRANKPMDAIVRELLTAPTLFPGGRVDVNDDRESPMVFNQVNEFKPENVASSASRLFMGVRLECAQCHDHPFQPYSRDQFWELAAFFADINPAVGFASDVSLKRRIRVGDTTRSVEARFFDNTEPQWDDKNSPRVIFANWLTAPENKFFARNMANRLWAHFFGYGILDPLDEPGDDNQPVHPELLDDLTKAFVDSKFDQKFMIRAITRSKAYQLSSRQSDPSQASPRTYAKMNIKGLSAEQLLDSLNVATGISNNAERRNRFNPLMARLASTERRVERSTSILQALALMNGGFLNNQTNPERSTALSAILDAPFLDRQGKIETIYLTAMSRQPTPEEWQKHMSYLERGGTEKSEKKALSDVFWALLNSSEFFLNH